MHYTTTEKECLSVVFCVSKFLEYVEGTNFVVYTDHSALTWLFKQKDLTGRLARWVLTLQEHNMIIKHIKGKNNVVADAISRFPICQILNCVHLLEFVRPTNDEWYEKLTQEVLLGKARSRRYKVQSGKLFYDPSIKGRRLSNWKWKIVIPKEGRPEVMHECHDDPKSAHLGVQKTIDKIMDRYYWPGLSRDVKLHVKNCETCKSSKSTNSKPQGFSGRERIALNPWQLISMDLLGPFPRSKKGFTTLLVVSDWFTKYPCLVPLRTATAKAIVDSVESNVFSQFGVPESVIMDNGPQFARSNKVKAMLKKYGIKRLWNNCHYHPQSNFTERHNKTIGAALRSYIKECHRDWDLHLTEIALALKTAVHAITGYSPFFLNHAREFVFDSSDYKLDLVEGTQVNDPYAKRTEFINSFLEATSKIHLKIQQSHARNKKYHDKNRVPGSYSLNDKIFLRNYVKSDAAIGFCKKLAPKFKPGIISKVISPIAFQVKDEQGNDLGKWHIQDIRH